MERKWKMILQEDTICAPATPAGKGGISVVRVSGPAALPVAMRLGGRTIGAMKSHTLRLATLRDAEGLIDQGVVSYYAGPASYTGEDVVEYAVHGSPYIVDRLLRALLAEGVRMAQPGEFTQRAFLNGRMDLSQAEAVADLVAGENKATHDIALRQLRGGFSSEIDGLREKLLDFVGLVELELDFGEEDVAFADRSRLQELLREIARKVDALRTSFRLGNALKEGISVAIIGKPNAGKSTLINALLHEDRALVSDIPGTTRDTIEEVWHIDGVKFRFIDTAGLRQGVDTVEKMGIERTVAKMKQARIWFYLFDVGVMTAGEARGEAERWIREIFGESVDFADGGRGLASGKEMDFELDSGWVSTSGSYSGLGSDTDAVSVPGTGVMSASGPVDDIPRVLLVANKADTIGRDASIDGDTIYLSARNQTGIDLLVQSLRSLLPVMPDNDAVILTNARHYEALGLVCEDLKKIEQGLRDGIPGDLLAMDIRSAIDHLGLITGKILADDVLGSVFSRFCIGK